MNEWMEEVMEKGRRVHKLVHVHNFYVFTRWLLGDVGAETREKWIYMLLMMIISTESYLPDYNAFIPSKL